MKHSKISSWNREIMLRALADAFRKLSPASLWRNPIILVTAVGALAVSLQIIYQYVNGSPNGFGLQIALWLWFTVLFANFSEAIAEGRGKAQADSLKRTRTKTMARCLRREEEIKIAATDLHKGDRVVCESGDTIPADGEVVEGIASVDESAITGESAPVIRESGGDRAAVTGGTRVLSDRIIVEVTAEPGHGFIDRMIGLVEGATRQRTPNEIALGILLTSLTLVFAGVCLSLPAFASFASAQPHSGTKVDTSLIVMVALFICLIPTTIGGLLSAIGISGIDRLVRRNVIATSGRAVEAAGDIDVLLLDKTGTITLGNRQAAELLPLPGVSLERLAEAAYLASLADETPEGRSIVTLAREKIGIRKVEGEDWQKTFVPFTAQTRMSGVDISNPTSNHNIRKGAVDSMRTWVAGRGRTIHPDITVLADKVARAGGTPLAVAFDAELLGIIHLKDIVKPGIRERFSELRKMGIRTVMITGDNPITAAAIAAEAGVDDFMAQATPEMKLARIRQEQSEGHLVAMTGDGTNDAPALAQADVGVAMNTGTQAAREAGNMVDLDSNPTKLIEIVAIGKQLLITRGALTTFSLANDVAKYFAIIPAIFSGLYATGTTTGPLACLNIMGLHSPQSAILSAVIFNALVIVALIPLALRGVNYRTGGAEKLLAYNLMVYGVGGLIAPFIGIKAIDVIITKLQLV